MFCPRCGQTQAAEEVRFCSRCGFPLGGVAELLANDGAWPALLPHGAQSQSLSPRRKGAKQGGVLILVGAFLVPILALLCVMFGLEPPIILAGVITLIAGVMRLLYALIFEDKYPAVAQTLAQAAATPQVNPATRRAALPPQQPPPAPVSFRTRDTGELAGPPSVTESTTRLLDQQAEPRGE